MKYYRADRVSSLIQKELNKIILKEIEIPDVLITITDVEVLRDLSQAIVKVSPYPSDRAEMILKTLQKNQKKLQFLLHRKINIKPMPQIFFKIDVGPEKAAIIEKKLLENR